MKKIVNDISQKFKPLTDKQYLSLKEIADTKWDEMSTKVQNLHKEVFEEIMEHEMALARLQTDELETSLSPAEKGKPSTRSLLFRLNTLSTSLKLKQDTGLRPKYDDSPLIEEDESVSCSEVDEDGKKKLTDTSQQKSKSNPRNTRFK